MGAWDSDQLWLKAKAYIDKANEVEHGDPHFPFWSSLALELLTRAALTYIHPVLNADPREDSNLLYACGFEIKQPRSLPAHSVYLRLEKTVKGFGKAQRELCDFLALLRNQELHSADLPFDNLKESKWLPRFYEVCMILCNSMEKELEDFLGNEVADAARKLINTLAKETEGTVKNSIAAHAKVFAEKKPDDQSSLQSNAKAALLKLPDHSKREVCPACGTLGLLTGQLIKSLPAIYFDDRLWTDQEYLATEFECLACELNLKTVEEIIYAGIEPRFTLQTETSLHDLYEPDFDYEYDNM
ncbi:MAG TPA: hypothetical protein VI306_06455 [Pyrinomonadaceae bacterium]